MKFKIQVLIKGREEPHWEEYCENIKDAQKWAKETVEFFNATLRPGEKSRKLLQVVVLDRDAIQKHDWEKTSVMTQHHLGRYYDEYKCIHCGVTGKRYTLDGTVQLDRKFSAKVYMRCDTSMKHITKKMEKQR